MCRLKFAVALFLLSSHSALAEDFQDRKPELAPTHNQVYDEETLIYGSKRLGDYSFITANAQKLVETAGAWGDPLSAIFSLPGVVYSSGEGSEPAVRGSSPADNQFVVDFMPASYIFHEFGVSIFSDYILHDFELYSAGVGAEFSDVTGAVFDVKLRDPKNKKLGGVLDLSMLRSGFLVEGGVSEDSAFYLSYRKSLLHLFISEEDVSDEDEGFIVQALPQDSDYQFKYLWSPNKRNRVYVNANGASDKAAAEFTEQSDFVRSNPDFEGEASFDRRYNGENTVWQYLRPNGEELSLGYGLLRNDSTLDWGDDFIFGTSERIKTLKFRYIIPVNKKVSTTVGAQRLSTRLGYNIDMPLFVCTEFDPGCEDSRRGRVDVEGSLDWIQRSMYSNTIWQQTPKLSLELGAQVHANDFTNETFLNPRISAAYKLYENTTLVAKSGRYNQFPMPEFVIEELGNPDLKSPQSTHYTLGLQQKFIDGWSFNAEVYYKTFRELPLSIEPSQPNAALLYENGTDGEAYGLDLMLNKNITDRFYGWMSLSYSKSFRENTRTKEVDEYQFDTPLIFNWVLNFQAKENLNLGWRWSIRSGRAYTPIIGVRENTLFEDSVLPVYGEAYSERLPMYNRLDFRLQWDSLTWGRESSLILDIINTLNIRNVEDRVLNYEEELQPGDEPATTDVVGFGIAPALTYRVLF